MMLLIVELACAFFVGLGIGVFVNHVRNERDRARREREEYEAMWARVRMINREGE